MSDNEEQSKKEITSPIKAIKAKCLDCCCGDRNEVKGCPVKDCPLWAFRLGKNPYRARTLTDEQRKAAAERLINARKKRETKGDDGETK